MGEIYITKITKQKYPNIIRSINEGRECLKDVVPVKTIYDVTYQGKGVTSIKFIGKFLSARRAMQAAKEYGLKRLHTSNPTIKVD